MTEGHHFIKMYFLTNYNQWEAMLLQDIINHTEYRKKCLIEHYS